MPRAKPNQKGGSRPQSSSPKRENDDEITAFVEYLRAIPTEADERQGEPAARPAKRPRTSGPDAICVARQRLTIAAPASSGPSIYYPLERIDIGEVVSLKVRNTDPDDSLQGQWALYVSSRTKSRTRGFRASFPLDNDALSAEVRSALMVAETQGFNPGDEDCIWASVDVCVRQDNSSLQLHIFIQVNWNPRATIWGSKKAKSSQQQTLREMVLGTWYPDLHLTTVLGQALPSWSPQDFYEAACVPDKAALDAEVSSMEVPKLEANLYPFQRRAVQWMLRREGVHWYQDPETKQTGILPYNSPTTSELPISFVTSKDSDGNDIYLSPLFRTLAKDVRPFTAFQEFRGGILAEEMGLGKTLEVISLILLHQRPQSPVMVFDPFLGQQLLSTSATLIIAPTTLLDQWLSELKRHAPSLRILFYPGIRKLARLKDGNEISAKYLAEQDVVVTTYEVLRTEIWAAVDEPDRSMRNEKQYERIKSPLVQLSWWRVCIDEAQMVENWTNNAAKLARRIPRINAWGVTGTPVKDDIQKDLRGLLLFLRYEPFASDTKLWNTLTTLDKPSFKKLFNSISMRHSKSMIRNEISIPAQKRYVITMPFTAVEEQHYQSLFEELAESCGLDVRGNPLRPDWDPEDPGVQNAMRVALDRLRQTVLHPEVGIRNRRALGQKSGPMRTVAEVLDAMLEQSDGSIRTDQRSLLSAKLTRGQILACQKKVDEALALWQEVLAKSTEMVAECGTQLEQEIQEAKKANANEYHQPSQADSEFDDRDEIVSPPVGEARRRLRYALEIQHRAVFFCANAYFTIKSDKERTDPGSEEFKRWEKLEVEGYEQAKQIRKEILHETQSKAKKLMGRLAHAAARKSFATIPEFKAINNKGIESYRIAMALEDLGVSLDAQASYLDDWREHVIQLLLKPLVDEEDSETTGEEYEQSTKLQDEILVYLQVLRTAIADRQAVLTGQKNFLVEHETNVAARLAKAGNGPYPEKLLELLKIRDTIKPPFQECDPLSSLRGLLSELRSLSAKLRHDAAMGSSRAAAEQAILSNLLKSTLNQQSEQMKAATAMEKELQQFMDTVNARIEFYRQLQEVSDMVADYKGPQEESALAAALENLERQEESLQTKLAATEAKHRYLLHLKEAEANSEEQRICIICQSPFTIGVLTICGHQFCKECMTLWFKEHRNCPVCKRHLTHSNLHDIVLKPQELKVHSESSNRDHEPSDQGHQLTNVSGIYKEFNAEKLAEIKNIDLDGPSFTTKVDTLVRHLLWLRESDPGAKSIVFSQYKEFLDVLGTAFRRYRIGYTSFDKARGITDFKEDPGTEVFLLHARAHASGLNLVNASHVFLCEPLLNTALELQAIARVDRIGQQHETTVWLYIVDGTVEESIYSLSVQRRMEHMAIRTLAGKGKELTSELSDTTLDEANALEMQQAHLSKLMGKDGISGETVDKDDLWTCLFGHLNKNKNSGIVGGSANPVNAATRRFLAAEAAERRIRGDQGDGE